MDKNIDVVISTSGLAVMDPASIVDVPRKAVVTQCVNDGVPTTKNDVYIIGVVLLEILTGKKQ